MLLRPLAISICALLGVAGVARGQTRSYVADPPTKGALYRDGQTGRYLLGGTWLYRADSATLAWRRAGGATYRDGRLVDGLAPERFQRGRLLASQLARVYRLVPQGLRCSRRGVRAYVPASARRWIIRFDAVNYRATVWLNGRPLGGHVGENLPFEFELNGVRAASTGWSSGRQSTLAVRPAPRQGVGWWNYGGILREVYLRAVQVADISQVRIRPLLPCPTCAATIGEQVLVRNMTGAPDGAGTRPLRKCATRFRLRHACAARKLDRTSGCADRPSAAVVDRSPGAVPRDGDAVRRARSALGGYVSYSGIRSITVTPDGRLALNGRLLNLRGVELHEQNITTGGALDPAQLAQLMGWVKALGATVIRTDPPNPRSRRWPTATGS